MRSFATVGIVALAAPASADAVIAVYVSEPREVRRVTPTSVTPIFTNNGDFVFCHGIALRPSTGDLYFGSANLGNIQRCKLDGTGCAAIATDSLPGDVVIDHAASKLYWASFNGDRIWRSELDGTNPVMLVDEAYGGSLWSLDLDLVNSKLYWTSWNVPVIKRANLDGTNIETITPVGVGEPRALALDVAGGKMYWADDGVSPAIQRANLDGSSPEVLVGSNLVNSPEGLALDLPNGKLYWADVGFIGVANLDGTNAMQWADSGTFQHSGFALVFGPAPPASPDASVGPDAPPSVGPDAGGEDPEMRTGGCGCRTSTPNAWLAMLGLLGLRRRR